MPRGHQQDISESCERCGEEDFEPNFLPEGQCYCNECAEDYWIKENEEPDGYEEE